MKPTKQFQIIRLLLAEFDAGVIDERMLTRALGLYLARG